MLKADGLLRYYLRRKPAKRKLTGNEGYLLLANRAHLVKHLTHEHAVASDGANRVAASKCAKGRQNCGLLPNEKTREPVMRAVYIAQGGDRMFVPGKHVAVGNLFKMKKGW